MVNIFCWTNKRFTFSVKKKEKKYSGVLQNSEFCQISKSAGYIHTTLDFNLLFNNRKVYVLEDLSYEESEMKIINYQIGITIILHLAILAMSISIPFITMVSSPRLVVPDIRKDQFGKYVIINSMYFVSKIVLAYCEKK